jgi:hypothetical protein
MQSRNGRPPRCMGCGVECHIQCPGRAPLTCNDTRQCPTLTTAAQIQPANVTTYEQVQRLGADIWVSPNNSRPNLTAQQDQLATTKHPLHTYTTFLAHQPFWHHPQGLLANLDQSQQQHTHKHVCILLPSPLAGACQPFCSAATVWATSCMSKE